MARIRKPLARNFNAPKKCGGKYCYSSRIEADQVMEEKAITNPEVALATYHCVSCGSYHLTQTNKDSLKI